MIEFGIAFEWHNELLFEGELHKVHVFGRGKPDVIERIFERNPVFHGLFYVQLDNLYLYSVYLVRILTGGTVTSRGEVWFTL